MRGHHHPPWECGDPVFGDDGDRGMAERIFGCAIDDERVADKLSVTFPFKRNGQSPR